MKAKINGTEIFFDVEGKQFVPDGKKMREKPVCFLAHGGPGCDHTVYVPGVSELSDSMQLVYIDNRGSGRSGYPNPSTYTLDNNIEDIEALRKYLGLDKIVLLGQSYGGMIAQGYAVKYQEHLSALILVTTAPSYRYIKEAEAELKKRGTQEQIEMGKYLFEGSFKSNDQFRQFFKLFGNLYSVNNYDEDASNEAFDREILSYQALNLGMSDFMTKFDYLEQLSDIKVPTLIIGARQDWITPVENTYRIAEKIPHGRVVILEHSSHSVFVDEPEKSLGAIRDFINQALC